MKLTLYLTTGGYAASFGLVYHVSLWQMLYDCRSLKMFMSLRNIAHMKGTCFRIFRQILSACSTWWAVAVFQSRSVLLNYNIFLVLMFKWYAISMSSFLKMLVKIQWSNIDCAESILCWICWDLVRFEHVSSAWFILQKLPLLVMLVSYPSFLLNFREQKFELVVTHTMIAAWCPFCWPVLVQTWTKTSTLPLFQPSSNFLSDLLFQDLRLAAGKPSLSDYYNADVSTRQRSQNISPVSWNTSVQP